MPVTTLAVERHGAAVRRGPAHTVAQVLSLSPFWVLIAIAADPAARLIEPLRATPTLLGFPVDAVLAIVALAWAVLGAVAVRYARSPLWESLALFGFTIPATILAGLAPMLVLVTASA
jgi:hypothetical protein